METVVLQSLSKTYSSGKLAVRQVSLALKHGGGVWIPRS